MTGALSGVKILDLTQGGGGPYCTMELGDSGAEVIKLEPPEGDWARKLGPPFVNGESVYFISLNRNKKSVVINLKHPKGLETALDLAKSCEVVVQNFRPGVVDRLGVGYDAVRRVNSAVIYCSMSALDSQGPEASDPGTELTLQARAGIMRGLGETGEAPVRFGTDAVATSAGLYAAQGILAALYHKARTGEGQHVKTSLLRGAIHVQTTTITFDCAPDGGLDDPRKRRGEPAAGFKTKDIPINFSFPYMLVGYPADERWKEFCRRVGLGHIVDDPRFANNYDRMAHAKELRRYYEEAFEDKTSAELLEILEELGALNTQFNDFPTLFSHPQILANDMVAEFDHTKAGRMKAVGIPWKMSESPGEIRLPPPLLGQHTQEVLQTEGFTKERIADLRNTGAIA